MTELEKVEKMGDAVIHIMRCIYNKTNVYICWSIVNRNIKFRSEVMADPYVILNIRDKITETVINIVNSGLTYVSVYDTDASSVIECFYKVFKILLILKYNITKVLKEV